jgi:hypothetical protein
VAASASTRGGRGKMGVAVVLRPAATSNSVCYV